MDDAHTELQKEVEDWYRVIKGAKEELLRIRTEECKHPEHKKEDYMWAPGHIMNDVDICVVCGEVKPVDYSVEAIQKLNK